MFEAVILAGGFGTRLKSVSGETPKPMMEINGKPFLYYLMQNLELAGCEKIVLALHYNAHYIIECIKKDCPVSIIVDWVIESEPLGTGGAIKFASAKIEKDRFIVLNGDTYLDMDYKEFFIASFASDLFISAASVENSFRYGTLELDDSNNVISMSEKGISGPNLINSGTYVVNKHDIQAFSVQSFSFESDFIPNFKGTFKAFKAKGLFIDIGIPQDFYNACQLFI